MAHTNREGNGLGRNLEVAPASKQTEQTKQWGAAYQRNGRVSCFFFFLTRRSLPPLPPPLLLLHPRSLLAIFQCPDKIRLRLAGIAPCQA